VKRSFPRIVLIALCVIGLVPALSAARIDPKLMGALKPRAIGPANMSGRIGAVEAVASNPNILYAGGADGGVFKSTDFGLSWTPVFDDQPASSIGAIAVDQGNPDVVWVGTGEAAPRNSVGVGRGVFLSLDAGRTWKQTGLEKTDKISRILLDPRDSRVAYVGALGSTWSDNPERGVYKTADGGRTWKRVLYVDDKTGVADMAMDPSNPNRILAALWQHRRYPWAFVSGGPGSGLYLTVNGGETWQKLTDANGLPHGDLGRIGIAFAVNRPEIAYALVEAKKSVLLRSSDGGVNWTVANDQDGIDNRPFYYSRIWVNPANENILYMLQTQLLASEDGGKTFAPLTSFGQSHSDYHAMWIHPRGDILVVGNDGGVVISTDRGRSWRFVATLPFGQFYHVNYDNEVPYNLYGGLQDNGTWRGPSTVLTERSGSEYLWQTVGGGDGFDAAPDPENPKAGYGMSQGGSLYYFDTATGLSRPCVPTEAEVPERYNWNAGFAVDPFHPATIYLGSQFVHKSPDKGRTWEIISPDLTRNEAAKQKQAESGGLTLDVSNAENYGTILCIAPSPLQEGLIWVSTDDGNIQLTRDGGKTWELVSKALTAGKRPLVPDGATIPQVRPGRFDAGTAYAVFDDHQRGNWAPYLCVTHDFGRTWTSLATPDIDGFCKTVLEDTVSKTLLFLGTQFGLFVSLDGGASWAKWTDGLPTTPVFDLALQPRENDLIIATHGRSLYIIDDISPLRQVSAAVLAEKLHLFQVPDAVMYQQGSLASFLSPGDGMFSAENKRPGACFTYSLVPMEKKPEEAAPETQPQMPPEFAARMRSMGGMPRMRGFGPMGMGPASSRVSITILDSEGKFVSRLNGTEDKGLNRAYWNFRETTPPREGERPAASGFEMASYFRYGGGGLAVLPGAYTVKIKYGDQEASQTFEVKTDPRLKVDPAVLKANYDLAKAANAMSETMQSAQREILSGRQATKTVLDAARQARNPKTGELVKAAMDLDGKLKALAEELSPTPAKQGLADMSSGLMSQVRQAAGGILRTGVEPVSQAARVKYDRVKVKAAAFLEKCNALFQTDVPAFQKKLVESGFSLFPPYRPLKLEGPKD
jgi:photosystem II stability/assembly factor-like uncharacterized protein